MDNFGVCHETQWGSKQVQCKGLWSGSTLWDVLKFLLGLRHKSFLPFPNRKDQ